MIKKIFPLCVLTVLVFIFFARFFIPSLSIPVTPDVSQSDILNLNYPLKYNLSKSLKEKMIPLWSPELATGFPVLAEGQMGTFNIFNLFMFGLFPMPLAYNLGLISIFLTTGIFTYLFARAIKLDQFSSLFAGIIFTFSAFFLAHIQHFNLIQTASFLPIEFLLVELFIQKRIGWLFFLLFPVVFSQQIFAGFPQIALYSIIGVALYLTLRSFFSKESIRKISTTFIILIVVVFVGLLLSAIQILPSWEFLKLSPRPVGLSLNMIDEFPFHPRNLLLFLYPFFWGNPANGTYTPEIEKWGIFWENSGYIGIIPLLFAITAVLFVFRKVRSELRIYLISFSLLTLVSLLLALGRFSPLVFLYSFPPLNIFRVPARFLFLADFSLAIMASLAFPLLISKIKRMKIKYVVAIAIIALVVFDLFSNWFFYHPKGNTKDWLIPPPTAQFLKSDTEQFRIYTIDPHTSWNTVLYKKGWEKNIESYKYFMSSLSPNFNLLFNIQSNWVYEIMLTRRLDLSKQLREREIKTESNKPSWTISEVGLKLLSLSNVKYIITPYNFEQKELEKVYETKNNLNLEPYFIYKNNNYLPRVSIVQNLIVARNIDELVETLTSGNFDPKKEVLLEKNIPQVHTLAKENNSWAKIEKDEKEKIVINANLENDGFLVLSDTYYPGWKAYVDGREKEILAANLNQRALFLEKGNHQIIFSYQPQSFKIGAVISLFLYLLLILVAVFKIFRIFPRVVLGLLSP